VNSLFLMPNQKLQLALIASLPLLLAGCSKPITDGQGRNLPAIGQSARLIEKHGWLATTESAVAEMLTPPKLTPPKLDDPPDRFDQWHRTMDAALEQNATRLKQEGKVVQVSPGSKVRILGYYADPPKIRPLLPQERMASWIKVEMLEGEAIKKTGFTTADGVAE
jgi:hypothetical protein